MPGPQEAQGEVAHVEFCAAGVSQPTVR